MCTQLQIPTDGPVVTARSMDFNIILPGRVCWVPKGTRFPDDSPVPPPLNPASWVTEHGFVGATVAIPVSGDEDGAHFYTDGLNVKGVSCAALWLPGTNYSDPKSSNNVYATDVCALVLGMADSVEGAKAILRFYNIVAPFHLVGGQPAPLHFIITDAAGASCVVEFLDGKTTFTDVPDGVLTNAPEYGWHTKHLTNYENLSVINLPTKVWGQTINGSGMVGLPGDATPPSRFVRATKMIGSRYRPQESREAHLDQNAIAFAVELLRTVMVPRGTVINPEPTAFPEGDFTQWATIRDHKNLIYYFWTAWNPTLQKLDLTQLNDQQVTAKQIPTNQPNWCSDVTSEMIHQRGPA